MAEIKVTEAMKVRTKNAVYLVEPVDVRGRPGHRVTKVEDFYPGGHPNVPLGGTWEGTNLYLEVGHYFYLGALHSSVVQSVEPVEPQH